ncbi:MAG: hypothetical protein ACXVYM_09895 [Gaiellaceae bacterium]
MGAFVILEGNQPSADRNYKGAYPANFVQGVDITCDAPPAGYVRQRFATEDPHVPGGIYPYWVPPAS